MIALGSIEGHIAEGQEQSLQYISKVPVYNLGLSFTIMMLLILHKNNEWKDYNKKITNGNKLKGIIVILT